MPLEQVNGEPVADSTPSDKISASPQPPDAELHQTGTMNNAIDDAIRPNGDGVADILDTQPRNGRRRRHGKRSRAAAHIVVVENANLSPKRKLPTNQYEVKLVRMAIRKKEDLETSADSSEEYGDTSLGMKLTVEEGKIIVQQLIPLEDGRASPAQLAGYIQRGDVLVGIDSRNLANLPADQLMGALSPLSTPNAAGIYKKELRVRLQSLTGLELLRKRESVVAGLSGDGVLLSFFPMVDQLGGYPLYHDVNEKENSRTQPDVNASAFSSKQGYVDADTMTLHETISKRLVRLKKIDRINSFSGFFAWNGRHSRLMRGEQFDKAQEREIMPLSLIDLVERGQRAILGAHALTKHVENVDKGVDKRSFRSWNSALSLRSQASARRRFVLDDSASLPLHFRKTPVVDEKSHRSDSMDSYRAESAASDEDEENEDGDAILLRLAARDEIWRKQVMDYLNEFDPAAESQMKILSKGDSSTSRDKVTDFSNLLLGDNVSELLSKEKRSTALPPDEVTAVLFDLTTKVSLSIPEETSALDSRDRFLQLPKHFRKPPDENIVLANQFLTEQALVAWLSTFNPLPWEQRRALWPRAKRTFGGSTTASTISDDLLSIDSFSTGLRTESDRLPARNIREQVEEQALDCETREETCFLVTYLFTQSMLPKLKQSPTKQSTLPSTLQFLRRYGAYLKLHVCLVHAALIKAVDVVDMLLKIARHDPRHREALRNASKKGSLLFYEPTMLSAILQRLTSISEENLPSVGSETIELCALAYPDVQPWQVKSATSKGGDWMERSSPYYLYLSRILHPIDGHSQAKKSRELVREWCVASANLAKTRDPVASRANLVSVINHKLDYDRDLPFLIDLLLGLDELNLAIDVAMELVDDKVTCEDEAVRKQIAFCVNQVVGDSIGLRNQQEFDTVRHVLALCNKVSRSQYLVFDVSKQLRDMIMKHQRSIDFQSSVHPMPFSLFSLIAAESYPADALKALTEIHASSNEQDIDLNLITCTLLERAANESVSSEMSVALMKVKHARMDIAAGTEQASDSPQLESILDQPTTNAGIWQGMEHGMLALAK